MFLQIFILGGVGIIVLAVLIFNNYFLYNPLYEKKRRNKNVRKHEKEHFKLSH